MILIFIAGIACGSIGTGIALALLSMNHDSHRSATADEHSDTDRSATP